MPGFGKALTEALYILRAMGNEEPVPMLMDGHAYLLTAHGLEVHLEPTDG